LMYSERSMLMLCINMTSIFTKSLEAFARASRHGCPALAAAVAVALALAPLRLWLGGT
jgi:hypothetical protein